MTPTPEQIEVAKKLCDRIIEKAMTRAGLPVNTRKRVWSYLHDPMDDFLAARDAEKDKVIAELRKESARFESLAAHRGLFIAEDGSGTKQREHIIEVERKRAEQAEAALAAEKQATLGMSVSGQQIQKKLRHVDSDLAAMTKERDLLLAKAGWSGLVTLYQNQIIDLEAELAALKAPVSDEEEREAFKDTMPKVVKENVRGCMRCGRGPGTHAGPLACANYVAPILDGEQERIDWALVEAGKPGKTHYRIKMALSILARALRSTKAALKEAEARLTDLHNRYVSGMGLCDECGTDYTFDPTDGGSVCVKCLRGKWDEAAAKLAALEIDKAEAMAALDIKENRCGFSCLGCGAFYTPMGYGKPWHRNGCASLEKKG